ncbi:DUF423 domain-containing protein [Pelagibius sp. CAU 1746]|uniref:DUF423 domain-containing protein n=1 Tax=Pelagibius sp. CAU 1746 TaxID=3140370 RepID=UPI00325A9CA4
MRSLWILIGLLGLAAVALGAYGSHGSAFADADRQRVFEVALRYHLAHLPALGLAALIGSLNPAAARRAGIAGTLFLAGMALFCGSLYLKGLGIAELTNPTAPLGGGLLMAGWLALAWAGLGLLRR